MPKTLIILAHPNLAQSTVNKHWAAALRRHADRFTVHELYAAYPQGKIDVAAEQKLVESHAALVWQFPVYWFNCPPRLKWVISNNPDLEPSYAIKASSPGRGFFVVCKPVNHKKATLAGGFCCCTTGTHQMMPLSFSLRKSFTLL